MPRSNPMGLSVRLRTVRRRLLCLIGLPEQSTDGAFTRQLVLVASPTAPHLRRLTVHRRLGAPSLLPDDAPEAA